LKFLGEVWVGRACAVANEVELTKVPKEGEKKGEAARKKGGPAYGLPPMVARQPWPAVCQIVGLSPFSHFFGFI
jgi:hypothetical protein